MEGFLFICLLILVVVVFVNHSKQKKERAADRQMIRDLTARVYLLEDFAKKLKQEPAKETVVAEPEIIVAAPAKPVAVSPLAPETKPQPEIAAASVKAPPAQVPLRVAAPSPSK